MKKLFIIVLLFVGTFVYSQSEIEDINKVLYHYIEGTANGEPDRLRRAFHPVRARHSWALRSQAGCNCSASFHGRSTR